MNLADFYSAHSHTNSVSGCTIWDGDFSREIPVIPTAAGNIPVRKALYEAVYGPQPYRTKFDPVCENPHCVAEKHISAVAPEKQQHEYPIEAVRKVVELHNQGFRQSIVAERLGLTVPTVSKYLKFAKSQPSALEAQSED